MPIQAPYILTNSSSSSSRHTHRDDLTQLCVRKKYQPQKIGRVCCAICAKRKNDGALFVSIVLTIHLWCSLKSILDFGMWWKMNVINCKTKTSLFVWQNFTKKNTNSCALLLHYGCVYVCVVWCVCVIDNETSKKCCKRRWDRLDWNVAKWRLLDAYFRLVSPLNLLYRHLLNGLWLDHLREEFLWQIPCMMKASWKKCN